jgi:hypothetical protein
VAATQRDAQQARGWNWVEEWSDPLVPRKRSELTVSCSEGQFQGL